MKKILLKTVFSFFLVFILSFAVQAQIQVSGGQSGEDLVNALLNQGLEISTVQLNCPEGAYGTFDGAGSIFGINSGITLTSGSITSLPGPNMYPAFTTLNESPGDPFLDELSTFPTNDACVLSFDLIPCGDILTFNYVFGSDEYNEYACSHYNDIFAFLISGPNPNGGDYNNINIALIPGSTLPVAINTVNNGIQGDGTNCISLDYEEYFNSNENNEYNTELDGFTIPFTTVAAVIPGQTYNLYLAIADASDARYDSAVMIEAGSLSGYFVSITTSTTVTSVGGTDELTEECVNGIITFETNAPVIDDYFIEYTISGSAVNGEDYETLSGYVIIPVGGISASVEINTISDGLAESDETITITIGAQNFCDQSTQEASFVLHDSPSVSACCNATINLGETTTLQVSGSIGDITWSPNDGSLSDIHSPNPVASPLVTTTYSVSSTVIDGCSTTSSVTVAVIQPPVCNPVAGLVSVAPYVCSGGSAQATVSGQYLEPGDVQIFALHNSPSGNVNMPGFTIYATSNNGVFNNGTYPLNIPLYISSIVGPDNGTGSPQLGDACTVVGTPAAVTFLTPVVVAVNEYCDWAITGDFNLVIAVTGGLPMVNGSYTLSGTNLNPIAVSAGQSTAIALGQFDGQTYTYTASDANGCNGSLSQTVICYKTPIELLYFSGKITDAGNLLYWVTGSEYLNDYFNIERSADAINYMAIGTEDGEMNSQSMLTYDFLDRFPLHGINYYRLKQTDLNGLSTYSDVVSLNRAEVHTGIINISPIPAQDQINLVLYELSAGYSDIILTDISGRIIKKQTLPITNGYNTMDLSIGELPDGIYFLQWNTANGQYLHKIVKNK